MSPSNLPHPASSFIGRDGEIAETLGLLKEGARLLTLSGSGGSGKSRLAIEVATRLTGDFPDGIYWVPLAVIRESRQLLQTIAAALDAKDDLAEHIGGRQQLLVLDNFEQIINAAPDLVPLLEKCPRLCVLVTSRERLRVAGETEYAVPPLSSVEAVQLFCVRARMEPDSSVAELCTRLDNLPLALELAAARSSVLSPTQILARLNERLDLFRGGRGVEPRQQTLRAAIEWSCQLLEPAELELFTRLGVFEGGCGLDAAEQVAGADVDGLQSLVDKSLLRHSDERFWMLETLREYAVERLAQTPDADALRARHLEWCVGFLQHAERNLLRGHADMAAAMAEEFSNIRAAVRYSLETGRIDRALELVRPRLFWQSVQSHTAEGAEWIETLLGRAEGVAPALRARVLRTAGDLLRVRGDLSGARDAMEQALAILDREGDRLAVAEASYTLGRVEMSVGAYARAEELTRAGLAAVQAGDEDQTLAELSSQLAELSYWLGDVAAAEQRATEVREDARAIGDTHTEAETVRVLAMVERDRGDLDLARSIAADSVRLFRGLADGYCMALGLVVLGDVELRGGEPAAAYAAFAEALDLQRTLGQWSRIADPIWGVAAVSVAVGKLEVGAQLLGAEERLRTELAAPCQVSTDERRDDLRRALERSLPRDVLTRWWQEGRNLPRDEAIALALALTSEQDAATADPTVTPQKSTILRHEGEFWTVAFEGSQFRLRDSKGLRYLALLLATPGQELHVLDLVTRTNSSGGGRAARLEGVDELHDSRQSDAGSILDERAKASYRDRLRELDDDLEEAVAWSDAGRISRITEEKDYLTHELAAAMGLGGRDRRASSDAERARINVTRAVRSALQRVREYDARLADHLDATVHTGTYCSYVPDPRNK